MAPPWTRTLTSISPKFLRFCANSWLMELPSASVKRNICTSSYYQQRTAGIIDFGKLLESRNAISGKTSPPAASCVFWPLGLKNEAPQGVFYSTSVAMSPEDIKKEMGLISEKFGEALELLNDARSSAGTVYFSEDMKDAELMVEDTLTHYKELLAKLEAKSRLDVQRSIGLKMEELKAQFQMIKDSIRD